MGDGFCDDSNNIEDCGYDEGDCCGLTSKKHFCVDCTCKCKQIHNYSKDTFACERSQSFFFQILLAKQMLIVMEMVIASWVFVYAQPIMSMLQIAQFMDVSTYLYMRWQNRISTPRP